ncbi:hypothetical protein [Polaribacter sargassicola]|uniref:hypothetical protein n=1 Tax=Polaribacter sargassicola TaxID=2836891 RepID=UPI001F29A84D|nr:hypothetical protein [Polaribacter sp. DS7-9]MCG1035144.1 hypothetical protein [Polaribacter sp. DS7-9]
MKKLILAMVFVFATGTIMNASVINSIREEIIFFEDCTSDAWEYGTQEGEGNPTLEYEYTNQYFELHCSEDGSYKNELSEVE